MDLRSGKTVAILVAAVVVLGVIAGWIGFLIRGPELESALKRAETAEEMLASIVQSSTAEATGSAAATTPTEPAAPTEDSTAEDGRFFCYISSIVDKNGGTYLTVDYAEFLTGQKAADAAAAAGEESPPPNDFFISNKNTKLREFPAKTSMTVTLTSTENGVQPVGYTVPFGDFQNYFTGAKPGPELKRQPFWITIENGTITEIAEQYLP